MGYFSTSEIVISRPERGVPTDVTVGWSLSGHTLIGDVVTFFLPNFTVVKTGVSVSNSVNRVSSDNGVSVTVDKKSGYYFQAVWYTNTSSLIFTCILPTTNNQIVNIIINESEGFITPFLGISEYSKDHYISTNSTDNQVKFQNIANITIIPYANNSFISFLSADYDRVVEVTDNYAIELYAGHGLNKYDIDTQISINSDIYTIFDIVGDYVRFKEKYRSTVIFLGFPYTSLYTPDVRPATYVNATNGDGMVFRYHIQKYDGSFFFQMVNQSIQVFIC